MAAGQCAAVLPLSPAFRGRRSHLSTLFAAAILLAGHLFLAACGGGGGGGGGGNGNGGGGSGGSSGGGGGSSGGGGGNGGGGNGGGGGTTSFYQEGHSDKLDAQKAGNILKESDFTIIPSSSSPSLRPYEAANLHYAAAAGFNGAGETIAIMALYLDAAHTEFKGRVAGNIGNKNPTKAELDALSRDNLHHATYVTGVAAAAKNKEGISGVASGARIHFASTDKGGSTLSDFAWFASAIDSARRAGAVAHNSSYSWTYEETRDGKPYRVPYLLEYVQDLMKKDNISASKALETYFKETDARRTGNPTADDSLPKANDIQTFIDAYKKFQEKGVVVVAHHNSPTPNANAFPAALPEIYPELRNRWIAVGNIDISKARTHKIVSAVCGKTAFYCLVQPGGTEDFPLHSTFRGGTYGTVHGTAVSAPQVTGAVAILNQAFPNHTPAQITARLLATADNTLTRFGGHGSGDTRAGTRNFGNGIRHSYYKNTGHGLMDLKKALEPVGGVSVASSASAHPAAYASRASLAETRLATSKAFGTNAASALASRSISVFDALNGAFSYPAEKLLTGRESGDSRVLERRIAHIARNRKRQLFTFGERFSLQADLRSGADADHSPPPASFRFTPDGRQRLSLNWRQDGADIFGLHGADVPTAAGALSEGRFGFALLGELRDGVGLSYAARGRGGVDWGFDALLGRAERTGGASQSAARDNRALTGRIGFSSAPGAKVSLVGGILIEGKTFLGAKGDGALALGDDTQTAFAGLSARLPIREKLAFIASGAAGISRPERRHGTIIDAISPLRVAQFSLGLARRDTFREGDRVLLDLSQPLRVTQGTARMQLATGRDRQGVAQFETVGIDLAPSGRQIDLGLAWDAPLSDALWLGAGVAAHWQPGHERDAAPAFSALAHIDYRF